MHDAYRLDALLAVGAQALLDRLRIGATAPVTRDEFDLQAEARGELLPQRREVAGLRHQHALARRERVYERRFPGAGARSRVDDYFAARAFEDALHSRDHALPQLGEVGAAVVHGRKVDRAQHPVGHVGGAGNLQEVAAGGAGHASILLARFMNARCSFPIRIVKTGDSALAARLRKELDAEVLFDAASRGRYSTDASIYQVEPVGIVVPRSEEAARGAIAIAASEGVPILPRGAGSSQCGQAVGAALIIDSTKHLNKIIDTDQAALKAVVQPGVVLDGLNAALRKHGLWFPVDVSTSAQATLGGMAGNNSCGSRSIAYGNMVHNVLAIDAVTVSGEQWRFGPMGDAGAQGGYREFVEKLKNLYERERDEIEARFPKLLRKVAGYNLDHLGPPHANAAHLLAGSEGTLAHPQRRHLKP